MKKEQLQTFDGKEGRKSYVSNEGKIYDVTDSRLWKNGKHVNKHFAGMDLTEALKSAPHGAEVLERFMQIDTLEEMKAAKKPEQKTFKDTVRSLYRLFHPHPMMIHFPMGLINFAVIMQIVWFVTKKESFELAAFYALCVSVLFLVPTIVSGFVSWWVNYELTMNRIFGMKIIFSIVLFFMCLLEVIMRFMSPELGTQMSGASIFYHAMVFLNVPVLAVIGFNGGKLSWG